MGTSPTLRTIAQMAKVSKTTVSLCLRDHPRIRPEVRQRIQRLAAEAGYRPNALVANLFAQLRTNKTATYQSTLGLLCVAKNPAELETVHTFRSWIAGCRARATEQGYGFDQLWLYEPGITPARLVEILDARNIRGLAVVGFYEGEALSRDFDPVWLRSAAVALGTRPVWPVIHFTSNDQYVTVFRAVRELDRTRLPAAGALPGQPYRQHRGKQVYGRVQRRPKAAFARTGHPGVRSPAGKEETFYSVAGASQAGGDFDDPLGGSGMGHVTRVWTCPATSGLRSWTSPPKPAPGPGCSRTAN